MSSGSESIPNSKVSPTAVIVAASAHWVLGAIWFSLFASPWLAGMGKTRADLMHRGNPATLYAAVFVLDLILAWAVAAVMSTTRRATVAGGMKVAGLLWLGLICTTMGARDIFEGRSLVTFAISAGYPLLGMLVMGAILGRWGRRPSRQESEEAG